MKLVFTKRALARLDAIADYYLSVAEPTVAYNINKQIIDAIDTLPSFPLQGQLEPWLTHRKKGYRRLVVNYL